MNMGGGEEEEGREGQTHYVVEQFVAEVSRVGFPSMPGSMECMGF